MSFVWWSSVISGRNVTSLKVIFVFFKQFYSIFTSTRWLRTFTHCPRWPDLIQCFSCLLDQEKPIIVCPNETLAYVNSSASNTSVYWDTPTVSDNSGTVSEMSTTATPGDTFSVGCVNVTYVVEDPSGNVEECQFAVCVEGMLKNII